MEYRHKVMRAAVGVVIDKAIRDVQSDPKRSIRNLADLGDNFSKTPAQKKFFGMAQEVLKNPDNPYNELLLNMVRNVSADTVKMISLNFGYMGLNYGAEILRGKESTSGKTIPWLLRFDCRTEGSNALNIKEMNKIITDAVSLGIYTCVFQIGSSCDRLEQILKLCHNHTDCCFFAAVSPEILFDRHRERLMKTPNLILSVDVTSGSDEGSAYCALRELHEAKCFYGFHARYTKQNAEWLMSDEFTRQMIDVGCFFGCYINADSREQELEDQVYRYVCSRRGKKGEPLFVFDFDRDEHYIGNAISCGTDICVDPDGKVYLADGRQIDLHSATLSEIVGMPEVKFN